MYAAYAFDIARSARRILKILKDQPLYRSSDPQVIGLNCSTLCKVARQQKVEQILMSPAGRTETSHDSSSKILQTKPGACFVSLEAIDV